MPIWCLIYRVMIILSILKHDPPTEKLSQMTVFNMGVYIYYTGCYVVCIYFSCRKNYNEDNLVFSQTF